MHAIGEHDLVGCGADADLGQAHLQLGAQGGVALGGAVAHRAHVTAPAQGAQGAQYAGFIQPLRGQAAGAGEDAVGAVLSHLAHQPGGVDGPLHGVAGLGRADRKGAIGYVEARAPAGLQVPQGHQPVVGLDHRETGYPILLGKLADWRQARAGTQDAVVDAGADGGDDLVHQRGGTVGGKDDLQHGVLRCIGRRAGQSG
jgi:hypothetical protein